MSDIGRPEPRVFDAHGAHANRPKNACKSSAGQNILDMMGALTAIIGTVRTLFVLTAGLLCVAGGCTTPPRGTVLGCDRDEAASPANLALGESAAATRLATLSCERSGWPTVDSGYRFDAISTYSTIGYDYQFGFNRYGGLYYGAEVVDTGTWLR